MFYDFKIDKQKELQKQSEIEGQKLKQRYDLEEQARKRKNLEEQGQLESAQLTERYKREQDAAN